MAIVATLLVVFVLETAFGYGLLSTQRSYIPHAYIVLDEYRDIHNSGHVRAKATIYIAKP